MPETFTYISKARLELKNGLRHATLGEVPEPVVYGVQGALRDYYGAREGPPIAATLDHIVAAVGGWMYGTLAGALRARQVDFDRSSYTADVEGTVEGPEKQTIRITRINVHYHLRLPAGQREAADRALELHPRGCPAHESVKDAIQVTWSADIEEA